MPNVQLRGVLPWAAATVESAGPAGFTCYEAGTVPGDADPPFAVVALINPAGWTRRALVDVAASGYLDLQVTIAAKGAEALYVLDLVRDELTDRSLLPAQLPALAGEAEALTDTWVTNVRSLGSPLGPLDADTLVNVIEDFRLFVARR